MADQDVRVLNNQVDNVESNNTASYATDVESSGETVITLPLNNELIDYASYNYIFTLACLTDTELADPDNTYRKRDPKITILRSGGGANSVYIKAEEEVGRIEYFIDNVEIDSIIVPNKKTKQTNATRISFQVTEPYSIGLFTQTLQRAAKDASASPNSLDGDRKSYLDAPFLLTLEFKGYDDNGKYIQKENLKRLIPIKFMNVTFTATESGCVYDCSCIPWNDQATLDQAQTINSDIKLIGSSVKELCQTSAYSISTAFNSREQFRRKQKEVSTANEYVIAFVKDPNDKLVSESDAQDNEGTSTAINERALSAKRLNELWKNSIHEKLSMEGTFEEELQSLYGIIIERSKLGEKIRSIANERKTNNRIGRSKMVDSFLDGTKKPFGRPRFTEIDGSPGQFARDKIQITDELQLFTFKAGTTIQDMIEEIILLSEYGRYIAKATPDAYGMIPWYKVETEVYNLVDPDQDTLSGTSAKIFVYKVVPYRTHLSRYAPPSESTSISELKRQCVKHYNYIYTGKNEDILDFDIQYNKAFFNAITPGGGIYKGGVKDELANARAGNNRSTPAVLNKGENSNYSASGHTSQIPTNRSNTGQIGGGPNDKVANTIARDFNDSLLNSTVDLVNIRMTIWGDPYYLTDSAYGNYRAIPSKEYINLNEDGTMNHLDGEVDILINFRSPVDYPLDHGFVDFTKGDMVTVGGFSGVYQVTGVLNKFSQGVFTQELRCIRRRNQPDVDTVTPAPEKSKLQSSVN